MSLSDQTAIASIQSQLEQLTSLLRRPDLSDPYARGSFAQALEVMGCGKTKFRDDWGPLMIEGIHYFPQPGGRCLWNLYLLNQMVMFWECDRALYDRAVQNWIANLPANQRQKLRRVS